MRDPKRIERIMEKFRQIWSADEINDWRFCQLYVNLLGRGDNFYLPDEELEKKLDEILKYGL